jgi:hypothetical protein
MSSRRTKHSPGRWFCLALLVVAGCTRQHAPASAPSGQAGATTRDGAVYATAAATEESSVAADEAQAEAVPEPEIEAPAEAPAPTTPPPPPAKASPMAGARVEASPSIALGESTPGPAGPTLTAGREPLLVYTAVLTMAVFGVDPALDQVETLARDGGGYLLARNDASITIRIPAARFRAALDGIGKVGDELHREVSASDVTEEYADLEIRLRNAEVMRQRLEALLARTNNVGEALAVERELERVCQTIEQLKGRLKVLGELVAFSTITVNFQPRAVDRVNSGVALPFEWLHELGLNRLLSL